MSEGSHKPSQNPPDAPAVGSLGRITLDPEAVTAIFSRLKAQYFAAGHSPDDYPAIERRCKMAVQTCIIVTTATVTHLRHRSTPTLDLPSLKSLTKWMCQLYASQGLSHNNSTSTKIRAAGHLAEVWAMIEALIHLFQKYPPANPEKEQGPSIPDTLLEDIRKIIRDENAALLANPQPRGQAKGTIYFKTDENRKNLLWTGDGEPDSGPGEWIPQVFKKWLPKA